MRPIVAAAIAAGALIALSGTARAVEIQNEDEETYQVTVTEGEDSATFTLGPRMTEGELCEGKCTIKIEGMGSIEVEKDEVVLIRSGSMTKRM